MKLFKKLENLFSAAAFAEAGEQQTAAGMASEDGEPDRQRTSEDVRLAGSPMAPRRRLAPRA